MRAAAVVALLLLAGCAGEAQTAAPPRTVVLELFTSQGCSSCPPADRLLSKLRREDSLIALAYHVDYWNYLGWRDPFSSPRWSQRQRAYARAIRGSQVYTPQLVVNGKVQLVGSSERHVRAEIERQRKQHDRGTVAIERVTRSGNALQVDLRTKSDRRANVVITLFENGIATAVRRGENANRDLVNDAIVRWQGIATGPSITIPLDKQWRADRLGVAAFLQDPASLEIHAAALKTSLR